MFALSHIQAELRDVETMDREPLTLIKGSDGAMEASECSTLSKTLL